MFTNSIPKKVVSIHFALKHRFNLKKYRLIFKNMLGFFSKDVFKLFREINAFNCIKKCCEDTTSMKIEGGGGLRRDILLYINAVLTFKSRLIFEDFQIFS